MKINYSTNNDIDSFYCFLRKYIKDNGRIKK